MVTLIMALTVGARHVADAVRAFGPLCPVIGVAT